MADIFLTEGVQLDSPATGAFAITPSDATLFAQPTRAIWVGGAGTLSVQFLDGTVISLTTISAGSLIPVRVNKVMAATTASALVGLY